MANRFYVSGQQRASKVNDLFAKIAPRYDLINDLQSFGLHRYWKRRMIRMAEIKPSEACLDLCCGTGDLAFALAEQGGSVVGLDFSGPMLEVARERLVRMQMSQSYASSISLIRGDALHLPFETHRFEAVTISYGLRNLADFEGGLREMLRVIKPGGRLLILDFGKPDNATWRSLYFTYLKLFVPVFGKLFCGDADTHGYILESLIHYPAQRGVAEMLTKLGCEETRIVNLLGGIMSINYAKKKR